MRIRKELIGFIAVTQSVLFLTHYLLYETWIFSPAGSETPGAFWIKLALGFLSVSFIAASLLAFRYTNPALRAFYRAAAVWMGLVSFLFLAAVSSWIIFGAARLAGLDLNFHRTVELLFGAAVAAGLYGVFNASWTRITRTTVRLATLPAWRGRRAALISDVHLGHENGRIPSGHYLPKSRSNFSPIKSGRICGILGSFTVPDSPLGGGEKIVQ